MTRQVPNINEIISFSVMLLMVVALVAGEADATVHRASVNAAAVAEAGSAEARSIERADVPFKTTINAQIGGQPLTISIDAVAEFSRVRFDD